MARKKEAPIPIKLDESTVLDVQNILGLQKSLKDKTERVQAEIKEAKAALAKKLGVGGAQISELLKTIAECRETPEMLRFKESIVESTEKVILG